MKIFPIVIAILLLALPLSATKYAGEIFAISPGVLSTAMGGTGLTYSDSFSAGWWNPALLGTNPSPGIELMRSSHFEGLMNQNQLSLCLGSDSRTSIIINHLSIDNVKLTRLEYPGEPISNENRPLVWKTVSNQDFIVSAGIARQLKETLYIGLAPKFAYRSLATHSGYAFGADLGVLWQATDKARLGANLRDFFSTQVLWESGAYEYVNPNLDVELAYEFKPLGIVPLHLAVRSEILAENRDATLNAGPFSADFHAGIALEPLPALRLLGGYDVDAITTGIGIRHKNFGLNYAFRNGSDDALGYSQRISASYQW